jgi:NAD(P)H-dependent FMN reductase
MESADRRPLFIPVVLGSVRSGRQSERPARLLCERVSAAGHRGEVVDLRELNLPMYGQHDDGAAHPSVARFQQTMAAADAQVWLSPEYNHSFTSAIKNAIDYLHAELRRKPAAVCGLSGGGLGGARAVEQLKLVLIELHALPIRDSVYFSNARSLFDAGGQLLGADFTGRIDDMLAELVWYARALRWGRENLPIPQRSRG